MFHVKTINICSVSGGKDSTALYCLMQEFHGNDFVPVFADTGHEHPVTLNYVRNLHHMTSGPEVKFVQRSFKELMRLRREAVQEEVDALLAEGGDPGEVVRKTARVKLLEAGPTGHAFLDLALWKGRVPSTKAQFCTEHLKLWPILFWLEARYPRDEYRWVMHTGIRAGESRKRSRMQPFSWNDFFDCESVLPMLYNDEGSEFDYLEAKGVPPNPLYALGFGRVGCFPCIHCNKDELSLLPDWAWDRLELYEGRMGRTWFPPNIVPGRWLTSVKEVRDWCRTTPRVRGNQFNMFREAPEDAPSCMTGWISCE